MVETGVEGVAQGKRVASLAQGQQRLLQLLGGDTVANGEEIGVALLAARERRLDGLEQEAQQLEPEPEDDKGTVRRGSAKPEGEVPDRLRQTKAHQPQKQAGDQRAPDELPANVVELEVAQLVGQHRHHL